MSLDVLLGGTLGALIVFVLGVLLEWSRRERERRGLLRLLLAEINHNEIVIKAIDESGTSLPESPHLDKLKTETWEENQQAALGLPDELLKALVNYYQPLEIFRTIQSLPPEDPNRPQDRPPQGWLEDWVEGIAKAFEPLMNTINELFGLPKTASTAPCGARYSYRWSSGCDACAGSRPKIHNPQSRDRESWCRR